ncbi:MAG TPA: DUF5698 domain-containing protein [Candidatus Methanoperedens sp.]|nr:DUF5698 domain-containing protein [Candidatus Methanoperedens sp.]
MNLQLIGQILGYFAIGFVEMFLATQRTYWISKGRSRAAALLVFFENFLAIYIIYQIANNLGDNIFVLVSYAFGNAIGTYINLEKVPF